MARYRLKVNFVNWKEGDIVEFEELSKYTGNWADSASWLEKIEENEIKTMIRVEERYDLDGEVRCYLVCQDDIFENEEDAEKHERILETQAKLRSMADWKEGGWNYIDSKNGIAMVREAQDGYASLDPKFATFESAQRAIDEIGEDNLFELFQYQWK